LFRSKPTADNPISEWNLPLTGLTKRFGDLKVRPKLMVLHNLFFLVLTLSVYFALLQLFENRVIAARDREIHLVTQLMQSGEPAGLTALRSYDFREGTATQLLIPEDAARYLDTHAGGSWHDAQRSDDYYTKAPSGLYRAVRLPYAAYNEMMRYTTWTLFVVLGVVYVLAVVLLEKVIMPLYVYRPLRLMLAADQATQRGEHNRELIEDKLIPYDEIGQIMRSRNRTVAELRRHEDELARALAQLEQTATDLQRKNELLEAAKRTLEQQDRLVSIGLLSASVAHELNTPLSVLHGSIEKMLETTPAGASRERLARVLRVTERLRKISVSLLDFARLRQREMAPAGLRAMVQESWELVAIDEKAGCVQFCNEVTEEMRVMGNADRLVQVFVNLLRNSLHAVEE
jgi:C4-dicarboxylate-specific signal transduction histidine kinase